MQDRVLKNDYKSSDTAAHSTLQRNIWLPPWTAPFCFCFFLQLAISYRLKIAQLKLQCNKKAKTRKTTTFVSPFSPPRASFFSSLSHSSANNNPLLNNTAFQISAETCWFTANPWCVYCTSAAKILTVNCTVVITYQKQSKALWAHTCLIARNVL